MYTVEGTEANPSSPYTRKRTSSFLRSLKSKLSTHSEVEEEEEEEEEEQSQVKEDSPKTRPRSTIQRSQSLKSSSPDKKRPAESSATMDRLDLAKSSIDPIQQKSSSAGNMYTYKYGLVTETCLYGLSYVHGSYRLISFFTGSSPVLPRTFPRRPMSISPLATHEARATSSPVLGPEGRLTVTPKFFEKGVGTQVMLSSTTSSLAKELLFDKARRLLEEDDVDELRDNTQKVHT